MEPARATATLRGRDFGGRVMSTTTKIDKASWVIAWDGETESHVYLRDADVVFTGAAIDFVGANFEGAADTVIDGAGLMVMPGLIDVHSHPGDDQRISLL